MLFLLLPLFLPPQASPQPEPVAWAFRAGQEFYLLQHQRQYLHVNSPVQATSYFDNTFLWRCHVQEAGRGHATIRISLMRILVNNPNETGSKATARMQLLDGSHSTWVLRESPAGWAIDFAASTPGSHPPPWILTLGTRNWQDAPFTWNQSWEMPIADWGAAELQLSLTFKQQTQESLTIHSTTKPVWKANSGDQPEVRILAAASSPMGLGEFDLQRRRWNYFEYRFSSTWSVRQGDAAASVKQEYFSSFRYFDRRPANIR